MIALAFALLAQFEDADVFARGRFGGWASGGFEFEALVPTGKREIEGDILASAGVDLGACLDRHWLVLAGAEFSVAGDVEIRTLHVSFGWQDRVKDFHDLDFRWSVTAGVLWGDFEVDKADFGDFDAGLGARAGLDVLVDVTGGLALGGYVEGRFIRFDYEETVIDGDRRAGGGGAAAGVMIEVRW